MAAPVADTTTRHVNSERDLPWANWGPGIDVKLLRVSEETGTYVLMARFGAGVVLPRHRHLGSVSAYTVSGRWRYLEYDWVATEGSFIYEPPGSTHTLTADEESVVVFTIDGGLLLLGPNDELLLYEDFSVARERYALALQMAGEDYPAGVLS
jgi:2,4'-dihydroxyacetophenone dioxygenase